MRFLPLQRPSNPDVEIQRRGFCVEVPKQLFVCAYSEQTNGCAMWFGGRVGFCKPSGPVTVFAAFYEAQSMAIKVSGTVVTVPRWNGHFREWSEVNG